MRHFNRSWIACTFSIVVVVGCTDQTSPSIDIEHEATDRDLPPSSQIVQQEERRTRWDAPWWDMDDAELVDSIAAYEGAVFIGLKEAGAHGGVNAEGEVLVSESVVAQGKAYLSGFGIEFDYEYRLIPAVVATIAPTMAPMLRRHPLVDYVVPVGRVEFEGTPTGILATGQDTTWNVDHVNAPEAWNSSTGAGIKLLVIDTGARTDHPDLDPDVVQACDGSNGLDQNGHGTHVMGIAAALDNFDHVIGVSHGVALWSSKTSFAASSVACAIEFGRINNVSVINMSFGTTETPALTDQIAGAYADGIFMAKSAGNTHGGSVTYPGTLSETVAVTAVDSMNNRASFAAIGPDVELAAPGVQVVSTSYPSGSSCTQGGFTGTCSGTSMAAPHVAAAAAILMSFEPSWTNADIRERLQQSAVDLGASGRDNEYGYGLIDLEAALDTAPAPPPPPPPFLVDILGPTEMRPFVQCLFQAQPSGGAAPYTYEWRVDKTLIGTSQAIYHTSGADDFRIEVSVRDANNDLAIEWVDVLVHSSAPECLDTLT